MIPADVASRLQVSADSALRQVAPAQEITDKLSGLVAGQRVMAEIQALLPNGTYRALINQRNLTLALPFSAKTGDAIELEVTESDGKLALAVVAKGEPEGKAARETTSTLSRTGQLISDLFAGTRETKGGPVALAFKGPVSATPPQNAQDLVPLLKQAISQSGMFYEAHQAEWVEGRLPTAALLQEPQGKLSSPAAFAAAEAQTSQAANLAADGKTAPARESAASPSTDSIKTSSAATGAPNSSGTIVAPQAQAIVQQQLEALATQTFAWQGQVWPGQEMSWEIDEDAGRPDGGEEPASQWTTRLRLVLPQLGEIDAQIRLNGHEVSFALRSDNAVTGELLRRASPGLRGQLDAAGLQVAAIGIDPLKKADG